jgi:outer membrane lipoprotein SlyB
MASKLGVLAVAAVAALGVAACGDDDDSGGGVTQPTATQAQTTQTQTQTTPPERPVTLQVNGEPRVVTLSRVDFGYCGEKTDVCAAIRGANFSRLSPVGQRAVRQARRRKAAREAAEREAERQRQLEQQQQEQAPPPQPESEGTTTG